MNVRQVVPRDAIPSVDDPEFGNQYDDAEEDRVVVFDPEDGPARAYPIRYLHYHEIVTDEAGEPIAVTWCPLCGSAVVYARGRWNVPHVRRLGKTRSTYCPPQFFRGSSSATDIQTASFFDRRAARATTGGNWPDFRRADCSPLRGRTTTGRLDSGLPSNAVFPRRTAMNARPCFWSCPSHAERMTTTAEIADFVTETEFDDLSEETVDELKKRVLDSLGIAVGAMGERPVEAVRTTVEEMDGSGCTLWGGGAASPPDATMLNTAYVRYLDYMDSFLAPGETPHPSDNVAGLVACGEYEDCAGDDLLTAVGIAYEVQGELAWNAPVRDRGWDHVTHTVISATAGAAKLLGLDREETRSAIGIAGTAHNALRVTRTEGISEWKGLASANAARNGVYSAMLAKNGVEGPTNLFEGQKGWKHIVSGDFEVDFSPGERVHDVMAKKYVAETYAQSAVEGIIELAEAEDIDPDDVESIHLDTFAGAKLIIGGGEGSRYEVETKAQADHSLPYMLAVSLIDREMTNAQYEPERIRRDDVQELLRTVEVEEDDELTDRFEAGEMPAVIDVRMEDGTTHHVEKADFEGHPNNSMSWEQIETKFDRMAGTRYDESRREQIVETVLQLETREIADLVALLD